MIDLLTQYQLRWLGHVARMPDIRHPKKLLFGLEMSYAWSQAGTRSIEI